MKTKLRSIDITFYVGFPSGIKHYNSYVQRYDARSEHLDNVGDPIMVRIYQNITYSSLLRIIRCGYAKVKNNS